MKDETRDLQRQVSQLSRQTPGIPVRYASAPRSHDGQQLAMITEVLNSGTTPHYDAPYTTSFLLPSTDTTMVVVYAVLLAPVSDSSPQFGIENPDSLALDNDLLRICALDIRREGNPKTGDIVRVWSSDGEPVEAGEYAFDFTGSPSQHAIYCEPVNAVEELRGLDTWDLSIDQVPLHLAGEKNLIWMDAAAFVSGPGGGGGGGGGTITSVIAGYGMDVSGTTAVTVIADPTEWTGWSTTANTIQFFFHDDTATAGTVTDPSWKTVADSDTSKNQMWWRKGSSFVFETTTDYGGSATSPQFLLNWGAGNGGEWQWKDAASYDDSASKQLLGHTNGTWAWVPDTRVSSVNLDTTGNSLRITITLEDSTTVSDTIPVADILNALSGYGSTVDQSIGHDDNAATEWQDDGVC